jgi:hypothetical protein
MVSNEWVMWKNGVNDALIWTRHEQLSRGSERFGQGSKPRWNELSDTLISSYKLLLFLKPVLNFGNHVFIISDNRFVILKLKVIIDVTNQKKIFVVDMVLEIRIRF